MKKFMGNVLCGLGTPAAMLFGTAAVLAITGVMAVALPVGAAAGLWVFTQGLELQK